MLAKVVEGGEEAGDADAGVDDITELEVLGVGAFGKVYKVSGASEYRRAFSRVSSAGFD